LLFESIRNEFSENDVGARELSPLRFNRTDAEYLITNVENFQTKSKLQGIYVKVGNTGGEIVIL
jgi:hypothetical protein